MNCSVIVCTFTVYIELEQRKISVTMLTAVFFRKCVPENDQIKKKIGDIALNL
jgi:hypothetical protein